MGNRRTAVTSTRPRGISPGDQRCLESYGVTKGRAGMQGTNGQHVAVVTGRDSGGSDQRRLAQAGYHVVVHAFSSSKKAQALAEELGGSGVPI